MSLNKELWAEAERLATRNYDFDTFNETLTNGEVVVLAKNPELRGSMAHGATFDEALENLKEARTEYIYSLLEDELEVPPPKVKATTFTGAKSAYVSSGSDVRTVVGLGSGFDRIFEPKEREKGIAVSHHGDFVKQG